MKKLLFFLPLVACIGLFYAYTSQQTSLNLSVKYNPVKHTLSISASGTPISAIVSELAKADFNLYIKDLDTDFKVSGRYSDQPVDDVLAKLIPAKYHYFYRVNDKATEVMLKQKTVAKRSTVEQTGNKMLSKKRSLPKLAAADALVGKEQFKAAPQAIDKDASVKTPPRFKGTAAMKTSASIKPAQLKESPDERKLKSAANETVRKRGGDHVVVTYKVTKTGMEAVSTSVEQGAYDPAGQTISNDMLVTGSDGSNVVFLQSVASPLAARSIYDPTNGHSEGHGTFEQAEGYVTVKMPKKYASTTSSRNLKVELVSIDKTQADVVLKKFQKKQLRTTDLTRSAKVISRAGTLDVSKIKTIRQ